MYIREKLTDKLKQELPETNSNIKVSLENDFLKLHMQQVSTHDGDWEHSKNILRNMDFSKLDTMAMKYPFRRKPYKEPEINIDKESLVKLGQLPNESYSRSVVMEGNVRSKKLT